MLRQKTKISQRLPDDLEEKITSFQSFVIRVRRSKNYSLVNIGNMDETPVWFDMPTSKTVDSVGAKTVLLKTTGHEKTRFTVVLVCLADGTKLKPMVIFKQKTMPKDNFPAGVVVHNHPKGWMDESEVKIWIEKEMVERYFKKCGISNALDGTEDDLVWEEEEDSSQVEEEPDCDVYDDRITPEQWQELFGVSNDEEEFHGF